jgi:hypothetical protein
MAARYAPRGCVKAKFMAVLGLAVFLLVLMPGLIYGSLAWVLRGSRLVRGREANAADATEIVKDASGS